MLTGNIILIEELAILLLLIATLVAIVFRRLRAPYTVGLVLVGATLAFLNEGQQASVTPEIILGLLVPPLLFEAAFNLEFDEFRRNLASILLLAIPGVVITMLLVAGVVAWGTGISLFVAIIFGALIAATDPVAVIALFRTLGVPKRLQVLIEGESLFNDGTAVVVFGLAVAATVTGEFNLVAGIVEFLYVAGGGILLGLILGSVISWMLRRLNDHLIETALTFLLAFGAYLLAEEVHVSGVLAVVTAGLVAGNLGPGAMGPTTRIVVYNFWQFAAFLANSFVFLLIGLEVEIPLLLANWSSILVAIGAVLLARAIVIYGSTRFTRDFPFRWQHVVFWGGLRGAISLALALSLPFSLGAERAQLQAMAFGVVLFTLLVQGLTMQPLIQRLAISPQHEQREIFSRHRAKAASLRAAYEHLKDIYRQGLISEHGWQHTSQRLSIYIDDVSHEVHELLESDPGLAREDIDLAWREVLRAQRGALIVLHADGTLNDRAFNDLVAHIDTALDEEELDWDTIAEIQIG